jgi:hypothetical protein
MRRLIQHALELGWVLSPYEADIGALQACGEDQHDVGIVNRREAEQARNLARLAESDEPMLVWCGNGHLLKVQLQDWRPMGLVLREVHGIDAFAIDQIATVKWPERGPNVRADDFREQLAERGGVAGFLSEDAPDGWLRAGADAYVLALDNEMT